VRSFVAAVLNGLQDTINDRDAAFEISKKYATDLGKTDGTTQQQVLGTSIELWRAPVLGYSDPAAWDNMQKVLLDMKMYTTALDLTKAFSNDFLPK
jgi:ABC-type nitrate/sulfonate/bicarbonate transport system substrate-binding protein